MSLLTNIQTLLSTWFPNKEQDRVNFDKWYKENTPRIFHMQDMTNWNTVTSGNDTFRISPYTIKTKNYAIEFKLNTLNAQIAVGDETGWVFACNFGMEYILYTHNADGSVQSESSIFSGASHSDIWRIEVKEKAILIYKNNILFAQRTNRKTTDYPLNIRIFPAGNASNIDYLSIQPLNIQRYTESDIIQKWGKYTNVSGRTIYKIPLGCNQTDTIILKFKFSSISSSSVLGIDLNDGTDYNHRIGVVESGTTLSSYYSSSSSYRNQYSDTTSLSTDSVYKIVLINGNKGIWYKDDVKFAEQNIESNNTSNLRYDLFNTNTSHLEYLEIIYGV